MQARHLTLFNDAGFGLHLLGHWVREKKVLNLQDAARKLTGDPATVFGIKGRGKLIAGYAADLLLFDPATVNRGPKKRVQDLPAGGTRLITPPAGVHGVWVNGTRIADAKGNLPPSPPSRKSVARIPVVARRQRLFANH